MINLTSNYTAEHMEMKNYGKRLIVFVCACVCVWMCACKCAPAPPCHLILTLSITLHKSFCVLHLGVCACVLNYV